VGAVLVDTSAIYALLVADDANHTPAVAALERLRDDGDELLSTSYVLQEATTLLQVRSGMHAVRDLHERLRPLLDVIWIDAEGHDRAMGAMLAAGSRKISLADWTSFEVMRTRGVEAAFAFDPDFRKRGFRTLP
jgi:predicted nucleic acid-binding protein